MPGFLGFLLRYFHVVTQHKAGGGALVFLSLQGDVNQSARLVNSGPGDLPVNSRENAPSHSGDVKSSM